MNTPDTKQEEAGGEQGGVVKVLYQNVRRAEVESHLILQLAVEKGATVVAVAEPWGKEGRRKQQAGYEVGYDSKYLTVYKLRGRELEIKGRGDYAQIGQEVAVAYLKPDFNWHTVQTKLETMEREGVHTIMGDLNCSGRKRRKLEEWMEQEEMQDIGTAEYTHRQGAHRCTIDRVITRTSARPWDIPERWDHGSDHAVIGAKIEIRHGTRKMKRIDWEAVEKWVEKREEFDAEWVGDAYEALRKKVREEWTREVRIVGRSKPWWKAEWKELRRKAKKSKAARRRLRREIRAAKQKMWNDWVEEGREVWDILRISRNPFNNRARCGTLKDDEGQTYDTDTEKFQAFRQHNLITEPAEARRAVGRQERKKAAAEVLQAASRALMGTKNGSAPGPDNISWKLLKAIRGGEGATCSWLSPPGGKQCEE